MPGMGNNLKHIIQSKAGTNIKYSIVSRRIGRLADTIDGSLRKLITLHLLLAQEQKNVQEFLHGL